VEGRGKGTAEAKVTAWLEPATEAETEVRVESDIILAGAAAQLSRGLLPEISRKLTQEFSDRLRASMLEAEAASAAEETAPGTPGTSPAEGIGTPQAPSPVRPVGGIRLGLSAAWAAIRSLVGRLFRPRSEHEGNESDKNDLAG
jgi:hypothetical protein